MSLGKLVEQLKQAKTLADRDIETNFNPDTIRGLRGQKARAVESVKQLTKQYRADLLKSTIFILTAGANKEEFISKAATDARVFTADAGGIYSDLVSKISPSLYGKEGLSNLFDIVGRVLENKALELDITGYPQLLFKQKYQRSVTSKEELLAVITEAVNDQVGGEIAGINAVSSIIGEAIKRGNGQERTPVILTTSDDELALELGDALKRLTLNVFTVTAGKAKKEFKSVGNLISLAKVTDEAVSQALELIVSKAK